MENREMEPRLYIIMREDLWDMNPGKGMAQAAHAQAMFDDYDFVYHDLYPTYCEWKGDRGFGVTTVLHEPKSVFYEITSEVVRHYGYVEDPTYPYRNYYGKVFTRSEKTCMWVFATDEEEIEYMKQFKLHQ